MRKLVATAALAASAGATVVGMPAAHAVSPDNTVLRICAAGGSIFYRAVTQSTNTSYQGGVQNHTCQDVIIGLTALTAPGPATLQRVRVSRLGTASSHLYCGPASEMQCNSPQFPSTEIFIDDLYGQSRLRGDNAEVTIPATNNNGFAPGLTSTVTFLTDTEM